MPGILRWHPEAETRVIDPGGGEREVVEEGESGHRVLGGEIIVSSDFGDLVNPNQATELSPSIPPCSASKSSQLKRFIGHLWSGATPRSFAAAIHADLAPTVWIAMNQGGPRKNPNNGGGGFRAGGGGFGLGRGGGYGPGGWGYGAWGGYGAGGDARRGFGGGGFNNGDGHGFGGGGVGIGGRGPGFGGAAIGGRGPRRPPFGPLGRGRGRNVWDRREHLESDYQLKEDTKNQPVQATAEDKETKLSDQ